MRTIAVATVGRSDWGIYQSVLRALAATTGVHTRILASGMHLSSEFGLTVQDVEAAGLGDVERIPMSLHDDRPLDVAAAMAEGISGFSACFARTKPDLLIVLGDRFEMFSAASAAVPFLIPIAHIHGGERTEGAIDEQLRHAITKLAHLHFVAAEEFGMRVRQMGEEPWRVVVSGAPALDTLAAVRPFAPSELAARLGGFDVTQTFLLCTFHPVTLEPEGVAAQGEALLAAVDDIGLPVVFTMPNADMGGRVLREQLARFAASRAQHRVVEALGFEGYASLLAYAAAMVGNSSSGLIEAPTFRLPVVNVGTRQDGRLRAANVIDVSPDRIAIVEGLRRALMSETRTALRDLVNPYGDGRAAGRITERVASIPIDGRLIRKRFIDAWERNDGKA